MGMRIYYNNQITSNSEFAQTALLPVVKITWILTV